MNCWIIWWTGNSKFKISSLIRQIKIKRSYLLEFLFYFWCCVMLLSITILDSSKVRFQNAWMLPGSLKISMYLFHLMHWSIGSISTPPPEEFLGHLNFWRLVCSPTPPQDQNCVQGADNSQKLMSCRGGCWSLLA